jgi:hypothetical protein
MAVTMGRQHLQSALLGVLLSVAISDAFVASPLRCNKQVVTVRQKENQETIIITSTAICSETPKVKGAGGLKEGMRNKLVTESIAPWRTIRLFLYGALGSGAFVGGLINLSGALAASSSPDFNLQTEVS